MDVSRYESPSGTHCSTVSIVDFKHVNAYRKGWSFARIQEYIFFSHVFVYK